MKRRQFLGAAGVAGATALAGCGSKVESIESEDELKEKVPAPTVGNGNPKGWNRIGDGWAQKYHDGTVIDAVGHGVRYEDTQFRNRVKEATLGRVDTSLAQFFAVRVDFFPEFGHNATVLQNIQNTAEDQLAERLRKQKYLRNVSREGKVRTISVETGEEVDFVGYSAEYPVEEIVVEDVKIPGAGTRSFEIPAQKIDVQGVVGKWKQNKSVYIAGGVYPSENFTASPRTSLSGEKNEGIDIVIDVDIGLEREKQRVFDLIRSVR